MGRPCSCAVTTCSASAPSPWTRCSPATRWCGPRARAARRQGYWWGRSRAATERSTCCGLGRSWAVTDGNGRYSTHALPLITDQYRPLPPMTPEVRRAHVTRARDLFNAGDYWLAHEALETVWRSIISDGDAAAARVWQGLIQAAAALLHQQRGNSHGVATVGRGALEKLAGRQRPDVEVETVRFRAQLERALAGDAERPRLELRGADGELRTDEGNR